MLNKNYLANNSVWISFAHKEKDINNLEKRGEIIKLEPKNKKKKMKKLFINLLKDKINLEKLINNQKKY